MRRLAKAFDLGLAYLLPRARTGVAIVGLHGLMPDDCPGGDGTVDAYQPFTPADLDQFITQARAAGIRFVCGRDLDRKSAEPAVWLTFDDGYANNLSALPILRKHGVPATFFITAGAVASGDAFWWDVLYREGFRRGGDTATLAARREALKALPPEAIRSTLIENFGAGAFRPQGALDRPMTPQELAAFARDPLVEIGNHTHNHAILPVLAAADQHREIAMCQEYLTRATGKTPRVIAYPNGGATATTLNLAAQCGLELGVTCLPHRNAWPPLDPVKDRMSLGRFMGLRHGAMAREMRLALAQPALS